MQPMSCQSNAWLRLLAAVCAVLLIWLVVLPAVSRQPSIARQMQFLDDRGIDPSARFYTDQPAGWTNAETMQQKISRSPEAFWSLTVPESNN